MDIRDFSHKSLIVSIVRTFCFRMHLEKLKVIVGEGKESAITQKNPQIKKAEETMKQIKYDLEEAAAEVS